MKGKLQSCQQVGKPILIGLPAKQKCISLLHCIILDNGQLHGTVYSSSHSGALNRRRATVWSSASLSLSTACGAEDRRTTPHWLIVTTCFRRSGGLWEHSLVKVYKPLCTIWLGHNLHNHNSTKIYCKKLPCRVYSEYFPHFTQELSKMQWNMFTAEKKTLTVVGKHHKQGIEYCRTHNKDTDTWSTTTAYIHL